MNRTLYKTKTFQKRIILSALFVWLYIGMNASTIHWITFIDTNDEHIGAMNKNAHDVIYDRFINVVNKEVAQYGYNHKIYDYSGDKCSPENCKYIIRDLQCGPNDVVVIYYIGHGYRTSSDFQNSKYTFCTFGMKPEKSIPLSWIHQQLKQKNVQLVLTIGVCSNVLVGVDYNPSINDVVLPTANNVRDSHTTVAETFLGSTGDIIVCSASPGQDSMGGPTNLGAMDYFTYSFVSCFDRLIEENRMGWGNLLQEVSIALSGITKELPIAKPQVPVYDCNLVPISMPQIGGKR